MMNYCQNILTLGKLNLRDGTTSFVSRPSSLFKEVTIGGSNLGLSTFYSHHTWWISKQTVL